MFRQSFFLYSELHFFAEAIGKFVSIFADKTRVIEKRLPVNEHQLDLGHITLCSFSIQKEGMGSSV
jgi:hypothetical protein